MLQVVKEDFWDYQITRLSNLKTNVIIIQCIYILNYQSTQ